jgi:hypothetical protein
MKIAKQDLREYERIDGSHLPAGFRHFLVDLGKGEKIDGEVVNYSPKGIRLLVSYPETAFNEDDVVILYPPGKQFNLVGEIVYKFAENNTHVYIGILFLDTDSLRDYRSLIAL